MSLQPTYFLATDPASPGLCRYILRLHAPLTLIAISNMDEHAPVIDDRYISKDYMKGNEVFQFTVMQYNDGISKFYINSFNEYEWILDDAWKWFSNIYNVIDYEQQVNRYALELAPIIYPIPSTDSNNTPISGDYSNECLEQRANECRGIAVYLVEKWLGIKKDE